MKTTKDIDEAYNRLDIDKAYDRLAFANLPKAVLIINMNMNACTCFLLSGILKSPLFALLGVCIGLLIFLELKK